MSVRTIFWFRKGLRLHDNPALLKALADNPESILPVFCLDPWFVLYGRVGIRRWIFLLETLANLDQNLKSMGSRLFVLRGDPVSAFPILFQEWKATHLYFESDTEPYAVQRDARISALAHNAHVKCVQVPGHTLFPYKSILSANKGKAPLNYNSFLKVISGLSVPDPVDAPKSLPKPGTLLNRKMTLPVKTEKSGISHEMNMEISRLFFEYLGGNDDSFSIPTIEELGFDSLDPSQKSPHHGGESVALQQLESFLANTQKAANFEKPNTSPIQIRPASTTVLSPHLKFGSLSCRLFYKRLNEVYKKAGKHSQPPVSLLGQLLWREFFYTLSAVNPQFGSMVGNPLCLQVDWKLSKSSDTDSIAKAHLSAWTNAQTGFPWIDAIMTQLRLEGWIHHLARHSVACFLTRGDLYISWERGVEVFDELLLDADWALNNGNWMWLSASAFFTQYFRVYSPIAFGKKYDKDGKYIKKYLPVLANMPMQYIFEPWTAPLAVQKAAGCIIGQDYPKPIVDHAIVSKENMASLKAAYAAGKRGSPSDIQELHHEEGDVVHEEVSAKRPGSPAQNDKHKKAK